MNRATVSTSLTTWPGEEKLEEEKVIVQEFFSSCFHFSHALIIHLRLTVLAVGFW